jgi:hypothetical protein
MALEMRDRCERCSETLVSDDDAYICTYECTFCPCCRDALQAVCPNCGGELVRRPRREPASLVACVVGSRDVGE